MKASEQSATKPRLQYLWCLCHCKIYDFPLCGPSPLTSYVQGSWCWARTRCCKTPKLLPCGTKMSLSLVFAPADAGEEMAEALPVCLWDGRGGVCNLPAPKQAQQSGSGFLLPCQTGQQMRSSETLFHGPGGGGVDHPTRRGFLDAQVAPAECPPPQACTMKKLFQPDEVCASEGTDRGGLE